MNLIGTLGDKAKVLCCSCLLLGVYEPSTFWRCERCSGQLFWLADRSASYDKIRDTAGGDDKLLRALNRTSGVLGPRRPDIQRIGGVK